MRRLSPRATGPAAIVVLVLATGTVMQASGWNQSSHYALTKSLAAGTATIDPYRHWTGDKARFEGHWYSSRAPGLALVSVPAYKILEVVGVPEAAAASEVLKREAEAIWALGLGALAAVALGAGTLLLPFSTMLFSHVLSAALAFAAFALLWREREGPSRLWLLAAPGALVGLGVATEYPIVFAGAALGVFALARGWRGRKGEPRRWALSAGARGAAYAAGVVAGVLPLLGYNWLAFGSPTHLAYADLKEHEAGFFGITLPKPAVAVELLFSSRGLLTLAPIIVLAVLGIVLLHRRGRRAEALTIAGVSVAFLIYNAGYYLPFGGEVPGPRFLISALPFLGAPLALALRRAPGPGVALAIASAVTMGAATITDPLVENEADTGSWAALLATGTFQETVVSALGLGTGWGAALPFVVGIGLALILAWVAALRAGLALAARQAALGAAALVAWGMLAILVPELLGLDSSAGSRIVAAGGSAAPDVDHGRLPLLELAALAVAVSLAGLGLAFVAARRHGRSASGRAPARQAAASSSTRTPPEPAGAPPRARL